MQELTIRFSGCSDLGRVRKENQDCFGKFPQDSEQLEGPHGQLFVVADGMGGHQGGQEASRIAVDTIQQYYFSQPGLDIGERLEKAFQRANEKIHQQANNDPRLYGMGTTCTALVLRDTFGYIAHVGDSRAYRINQEKLERLTQDHSHVAEMQRQGILTESEAKHHPQRSVLTRALGILPSIEVDIVAGIEIEPGDFFLLCSDGLAPVEEAKYKEVILANPPEKACKQLIKLANEASGDDNVTIQVVQIMTASDSSSKLRTSFMRFWH